MSIIYERIDSLCKEKNTTITAVCRELQIPRSVFSELKVGRTKSISTDKAELIADYFNCSVDYLIGRTDIRIDESVLDKVAEIDDDLLEQAGNIYDAQKLQKERDTKSSVEYLFFDTVSRREIQHITKYRTLDGYGKKAVDDLLENEYERCAAVDDKPKVITLPMAELKASAGTGQWLGDEEYTTWVDVLDTPESRRANVVIEVSGDSMMPDYNDGDKVLVKLNAEPNKNEIGIFIIENNGYIKKLGKDKLISLNKDYPDIPFTENAEVIFVGKVIGKAELI